MSRLNMAAEPVALSDPSSGPFPRGVTQACPQPANQNLTCRLPDSCLWVSSSQRSVKGLEAFKPGLVASLRTQILSGERRKASRWALLCYADTIVDRDTG